MTDSRNFEALEHAWIAERRRLHRRIDELAERLRQQREAPDTETPQSARAERMVFPSDLPVPFTGMKLWHHLYHHQGIVISHDELCKQFCAPSARWPHRSMQATVSKVRLHLCKHALTAKYGIITIPTVGYTIMQAPTKGATQ